MTQERSEKFHQVLSHRQADLAIVMENVHDPHNISAVMRTCDAVGIQDIFVINSMIPKHAYFGPKSSSSAAKWLTVHQFTTIEDCIPVLRSRYSKIYCTHLSTDAVDLYEVDFTKESIAIVFGNEHVGVSDEMRTHSDGNIIIPQVGMIKSLNISVACAISIYEAFRQKKIAGHYQTPSLSEERIQEIRTVWSKPKVKFRFKDLRALKRATQ